MESKNQLSSIRLDIDSKENVVSLFYKGDSEYIESLKKRYSGQNISVWLNLDSEGILERDKVLGAIRKRIYEFRSDQFHLNLRNDDYDDPLICRCLKITRNDLEKSYHENKGDKKKILLATHMSGICGTCKNDFNSFYSLFESKKTYIEGLPSSYWIEKVNGYINDFYMVCPPDYSDLKFEVISMNSFNLKIRCHRGESTLKRVEIQDTLNNYLSSELKLDLKLSVII